MWWNKYVGIPFEEKGRTAQACDCWGLVRLIYKNELGIDLPSYDEHYRHTNDTEMIDGHINTVYTENWSHPETPQPFDIVILKRRGIPMHVGVVTNAGNMIHCESGIGAVIERYNSIRWNYGKNVVGFARYE